MKRFTKTGLVAIATVGLLLVGATGANAAVGSKGWYTEDDDAKPTFSAEGIVFADGGTIAGKPAATGILHPVDVALADLPTIKYTAVGDTQFLHVRIVTNAVDGYTSLSVLDGSPITSDSLVYVSGLPVTGAETMTIADFEERYPTAGVLAVGFHFDSNAEPGDDATVTSTNINGKVKSSR